MRIAFVALALVLFASCASDKYRPRTTEWGDDDDEAPVVRAPAADKPQGETKKLTASELANSLRSPIACEQKADEYYKRDKKAGLALLRACVERSDFTDLNMLLKPPWNTEIKVEPKLQAMIAEVCARRGGFVERDTWLARQAGIQIYDVNTALAAKDAAIGRLVLARGAVTNVGEDKQMGTVATIAESSWSDIANDDAKAPEPKDDLEGKTGRFVFARVDKKDDRFAPGKQFVFVLRHEAKRTHKDPTSDDELTTVFGKFLAAYDASPKLLELQ
jgi:hypothetical protein